MGSGGVAGWQPPVPRPTWTPWAPLTPLGRLGKWGGCLGLADSPEILLDVFRVGSESPGKRGGGLSSERRAGRGIHAFLGHLAYRADLVPGMEFLTLLGVNQDGTVHLLHSFFSILIGQYFTDRWLFAFVWDLLN